VGGRMIPEPKVKRKGIILDTSHVIRTWATYPSRAQGIQGLVECESFAPCRSVGVSALFRRAQMLHLLVNQNDAMFAKFPSRGGGSQA
jgi:hypothetical protein